MKMAQIIVAIVIAAATVASAQTPDSKQKPGAAAKAAEGDVEQTLMKIERDATAALVKRDAAGFGRIFAEDAVLTSPDGTCRPNRSYWPT